jgi:hypothetical protein
METQRLSLILSYVGFAYEREDVLPLTNRAQQNYLVIGAGLVVVCLVYERKSLDSVFFLDVLN